MINLFVSAKEILYKNKGIRVSQLARMSSLFPDW